MIEEKRGPLGFVSTEKEPIAPKYDLSAIPEAKVYSVDPDKEFLQKQLIAKAIDGLSATDWLIVRASERGQEVSEKIKAYRDALRDVASGMSSTLPLEP